MSKVKVKMELEFWYDPETNEYEAISNKVINNGAQATKAEKVSKKVVKSTSDDESTPMITLEDNKLVLNSKATEVLGVAWEDRVAVKYQKIDGKMCPVIASDEAFGTHSGNKLTKSNTISFRGKANEELSKYGSEFKLIQKDDSQIYKMEGNKDPKPYVKADPAIKVKESDEDVDLSDLTDSFPDLDGDAVEIKFDLTTL